MTRIGNIIMSGPMVRALLDGRKTQTRRLAYKRPPRRWDQPDYVDNRNMTAWLKMHRRFEAAGEGYREWLYVKEAFRLHESYDDLPLPRCPNDSPIWFTADQDEPDFAGRWRNRLYMTKARSRLSLEITGTKLERLQEISEADCIAEGAQGPQPALIGGDVCEIGPPTYEIGFQELWNSLHKDAPWESNPEVVALTLVCHKANIDQIAEAA